MLKTWGSRGGVSRSNGGGCRLWSGRKRQIQHLKVPPRSAKKLKKKKHSTLKDSILTNSYRLGFFFYIGSAKVQFNALSSDFIPFYP
jgi:hypothetical protein